MGPYRKCIVALREQRIGSMRKRKSFSVSYGYGLFFFRCLFYSLAFATPTTVPLAEKQAADVLLIVI